MNFSERYSRHINLKGFGKESQQKLSEAKVLVVGAGGLGLPALQYLASMGVGTIGIVDGDVVSESNLNRQILYSPEEVGQFKVKVAEKKLSSQNPGITIKSYNTFLDADNAIQIIHGFHLVIDATDNFSARYLINDACVMLGKPFVYGAIQDFEGHVSVFNLGDGPTYRCLYPDFPADGEIPDCNTAGVLGVVPGIVGCYQALEAVKVITGVGKTAAGFLMIFDFLNNDQYQVKLKVNPENKKITQLKETYSAPNCSSVPNLKPGELYEWLTSNKEFLLFDVREQDEYEQSHLANSINYPLSAINGGIAEISPKKPVVTFCQKGGRSMQAANILLEKNYFLKVYSVEGGMDQWLKEIGNKLVVT